MGVPGPVLNAAGMWSHLLLTQSIEMKFIIFLILQELWQIKRLPKVTQLVSGRVGVGTLSLAPCSSSLHLVASPGAVHCPKGGRCQVQGAGRSQAQER